MWVVYMHPNILPILALVCIINAKNRLAVPQFRNISTYFSLCINIGTAFNAGSDIILVRECIPLVI